MPMREKRGHLFLFLNFIKEEQLSHKNFYNEKLKPIDVGDNA